MGIDANVSLKPSGEPELPRVYVDTTYYAPTGDTHHVAAGGNLQTAINAASLGDVITLEAGATFTGDFTLPDKGAGTDYIIIRTDTTDQNFVAEGTRVAPADASLMAKVAASSGAAITSSSNAHHYRFVGIEFAAAASTYMLIDLSGGQDAVATQSNHIIFDRCYIHGHATSGTVRGISAQGQYIGVVDSYLSNFRYVGADSQAFASWWGAGPFKIVNNYIEAAGENVMCGGSTSTIEDVVPSDIEVRQNHFYKPLSWKVDDPSYAGTHWSVKNIFELKTGKRVLIEGNLFENCWADAQVGIAILFTVRTEDGDMPWAAVHDVTFRHNVLRGTASAINILGKDYGDEGNFESLGTKRIAILNNLILDVDSTTWGGAGTLLQLLQGPSDVRMEHNTVRHSGNVITVASGACAGFTYRNNLSSHNEYGIIGDGTGTGNSTIQVYMPDSLIDGNVLADAPSQSSSYPANNYFPNTFEDIEFEDLDGGDYRLASGSSYKSAATDGTDIGINKSTLDTAMGSLAETYW